MNCVGDVASTFFHGVWDMLLHTDFPGVGISFAAVLVGFFVIRFSLRLLGYVTGFNGMNGSDYGRAATMAEKAKNYNQHKKVE